MMISSGYPPKLSGIVGLDYARRNPRVRLQWLLMALFLCTGCSAPGYVLRQAVTQAKILNQRQRIKVMLRESPGLSADHRLKLQVVLAARRFSQRELGLKTTSAYTRFYDTGGKPLAHNLSASPKDSLKPHVWRFPIVGGLPYIGFFTHEEGLREQEKLRARGLDTYYRPVAAFSSLGWFADPVYSPMLESSVGRIVDLVLHETTHTTIFLRNKVAFNESLATFVGKQGTKLFLAQMYGPHSAEVRAFAAKIRRRNKFGRLISSLYNRLERLYGSDLSSTEKVRQREAHFTWARERYKELNPDPRSWGSFMHRPLNNAVLLSYGRYNQGVDFHRRVYRCLGRDLGRFVALYKRAQRTSAPIAHVARACGLQWWVKQEY